MTDAQSASLNRSAAFASIGVASLLLALKAHAAFASSADRGAVRILPE